MSKSESVDDSPEAGSTPMPSIVDELEDWLFGDKSRSISIEHDDGYGASCWSVTLGQGSQKVVCEETSFISQKGVDPRWYEHGQDLHTVASLDDWPGLSKTVKHALSCASKFFWPLNTETDLR